MERVLTTKEARAMFAALDDQREAREYAAAFTLGELFGDSLRPSASALEGAVDGLLAPYYRGALEARARLARELRAYIVEETDAEGVYTEHDGE